MRFETASIRSVLGLRFRDATTERPVTEGLQVTVRRKDGSGPPTRAVRTVSGAYVAQGLAGLRAYERVPEDIPEDIPEDPSELNNEDSSDLDNKLIKKDYLVDVRDQRGRFVPVLLKIKLPYTPRPEFGGLRSIAETPSDIEAEDSDEETPEPTCYLFSAVQRPVRAGQAVVYADLVAEKKGSWQPAAHAVLEVRRESNSSTSNGNSNDSSNSDGNDGAVWYGVADADGRVAVQFPAPSVQLPGSGSGGSNPAAPGERKPLSTLSAHTWSLTVKVRYEPSTLKVPNEAERPSLPSIFQQKSGTLYADPSTAKNKLSETLSYGEPLVLRTDGHSALRIAPSSNNP